MRNAWYLRFKNAETADPSAETIPKICAKSRKTRPRVFGPNPHCDLRFGGPAPRPPIFCGIVRTLLMLRFKNAKSQILVRKGRNLKSPKTTENPKQRPRGRMARALRELSQSFRRASAGLSQHLPRAPRGLSQNSRRSFAELSQNSWNLSAL